MSDRDALLQIKAIADAALGVAPPVPPAGETCEQFIARMYTTYLRRAPVNGEEAGWVQACKSGTPRSQIEDAFKNSPEANPPGQPSGGNPAAIVPAWSPWNLIQIIKQPSGYIAAYPIPAEAGLFTQGQMGQGHTPSACKTEFQISASPGVMDAPQFTSHNVAYNSLEVSGHGGEFMNVRWTYPEGNGLGFSIQWA